MAALIVPSHPELAAGWAFVLQYARDIRRICNAIDIDRDVDREDLHQDSCYRIARTFSVSFDPSRGSPVIWIRFMIRRTHADLYRDAARQRATFRVQPTTRRDGTEDMSEAWASDSSADANATLARVELARVTSRATLPELLAIEALQDELEKDEVALSVPGAKDLEDCRDAALGAYREVVRRRRVESPGLFARRYQTGREA